MSNSYILTPGGISILIAGKPYAVDKSHINYDDVLTAVRSKAYASIPELLNLKAVLQEKFSNSELSVENGQVMFRGTQLNGQLQARVLEMFAANFDLTPMSSFLTRLYSNPSKKAVDELFGWVSKNGITISEDGFLYAYKRVRDDYTSFHDSETKNNVGTFVEMPRNAVDDRSENTCSYGLHFCSQSYLPVYCGGQGRVLLLKIDPADVVSIPTDYDHAKGRACKYFVESDLSGDARERVEQQDVLKQAVVRNAEDVSASNAYKAAYKLGYKDGRGKQKKYKSMAETRIRPGSDEINGYDAGFIEGRQKQPKRYS